MKSCPENPTPLTCGLVSAEFLVDGEHIEIDQRERKSLKLDEMGRVALGEVLIYRDTIIFEGGVDVLLQCAKCLIQIISISDGPDGLMTEPAGKLPF